MKAFVQCLFQNITIINLIAYLSGCSCSTKFVCKLRVGCNAAKCVNGDECIIGNLKKQTSTQSCSIDGCNTDILWVSNHEEDDDKEGNRYINP